MSTSNPTLSNRLSALKADRLLDNVLEATIVGSFTKLGFAARQKAEGWDTTPAALLGQTAIVTGATSGIGKATAAGLLALGADVHITSRDMGRAEEAAAELNETALGAMTRDPDARREGARGKTVTAETARSASGPEAASPNGLDRAMESAGVGGDRRLGAVPHALDTGDFDSIGAFVNEARGWSGGIDMLINNAGALTEDRRVDPRGVELTLSSHLIGPYLLMTELKGSLNRGARVVFMASGGMYSQGLDVDHIEMSEKNYSGTGAYARAKRGQVELVTHLAPEWAPEVILHSMHPGWVDTPGVDAGLPLFGKVMGPLLRTAEQGADTMVWLAATGGEGAEPGQFWLDRRPRGTSYVPGTSTDSAERQRLVDWLELQVASGRQVPSTK